MDLLKQLTSKNPSEYEAAAKHLVEASDKELFAKLVKQDDFLFDFIKANVVERIKRACTQENYLNILDFFECYSPTYDDMFGELLYHYGEENLFIRMKDLYHNGSNSQKAYSAKYFIHADKNKIRNFVEEIRKNAESDFEPLAANSIELLAYIEDSFLKEKAIERLDSSDEFVQFDAVKFLVNYQAKDCIDKIIKVIKTSSLSENIASLIPFLVPLEDLIKNNYEEGMLVLAHIINGLPEIIPISYTQDFNFKEIFGNLINSKLDSISALILMMAKTKFVELVQNDEYLYDCDKNTKDLIKEISSELSGLDNRKLKNLLYEELYEDSDFVLFALDYINEPEELRTLLDSNNAVIVLKALSQLKENNNLLQTDKDDVLKNIKDEQIVEIIKSL